MHILDPTNSIIFKPGDSNSIYVSGKHYVYINPYERLKLGKNLEFTSEKDDETLMNRSKKYALKIGICLNHFTKKIKIFMKRLLKRNLAYRSIFNSIFFI